MMPHQHFLYATTGASITTERNLSLAELIRITLSQDLGSNHLEEYTKNVHLQIDSDDVISQILCDIDTRYFQTLASNQYQRVYVFDAPATKAGYFFTIGLRAPPSLS